MNKHKRIELSVLLRSFQMHKGTGNINSGLMCLVGGFFAGQWSCSQGQLADRDINRTSINRLTFQLGMHSG